MLAHLRKYLVQCAEEERPSTLLRLRPTCENLIDVLLAILQEHYLDEPPEDGKSGGALCVLNGGGNYLQLVQRGLLQKIGTNYSCRRLSARPQAPLAGINIANFAAVSRRVPLLPRDSFDLLIIDGRQPRPLSEALPTISELDPVFTAVLVTSSLNVGDLCKRYGDPYVVE